MSTSIHADRLFAHPPAAVWRALTDPALMSRWLMPTDFQPVLGARFTFDTGNWGKAQCEVLEIVPESRLKISGLQPALQSGSPSSQSSPALMRGASARASGTTRHNGRSTPGAPPSRRTRPAS